MDRVDLALSRILLEDSRTSYSEMGKMVGLTTQAVHRRVKNLFDEGIIEGTVTRPSLAALGLTHVIIQGYSKCPSMDDVADRLSKHPAIAVMQTASGNRLYVHAGIESADGLANLVSHIQKEASLSSLQVGMVDGPPIAPAGSLTRTDLRIIAALRDDSRRTVADISEQLGVTAKTIRNRIKRMKDEGLVTFTIKWRPDAHGDTVSKIHVKLREDVPREKVALYMVSHFSDNIINTVSLSNIPDTLMVTIWTESVRDMNRLCKDLYSTGLVESAYPVVLLDIHYFSPSM